MDHNVLRQVVQRAYSEHEVLVTGKRHRFVSFARSFGLCLISTYDLAHAAAITLVFLAVYVISVHKFGANWRYNALVDKRLWADFVVLLLGWRLCFDLITSAAHRPFRRTLRFWFVYLCAAGLLDVVVEALWWLIRQLTRRNLGAMDYLYDLNQKKNKIVDNVTGAITVAYTVGKYVVAIVIALIPYIQKFIRCAIWLKTYLSFLELTTLIVVCHAVYVILDEGVLSGAYYAGSAEVEAPRIPPVWSRWFVYVSEIDAPMKSSLVFRPSDTPQITAPSSPATVPPYSVDVERSPLLDPRAQSAAYEPLSDSRRRSIHPPQQIFHITPWYRILTQCFCRGLLRCCCKATAANSRYSRLFTYLMNLASNFGSITVSYSICAKGTLQILIDRAGDPDAEVRLDGRVQLPIQTAASVNVHRFTYGGTSHEKMQGNGILHLLRSKNMLEKISWSAVQLNNLVIADIRGQVAASRRLPLDTLYVFGGSDCSVRALCVVAFYLQQCTNFQNICCVVDNQKLSEISCAPFMAHIISIGDGWRFLDTPSPNVMLLDAQLSVTSIWECSRGVSTMNPESNFFCHSCSNNFTTQYYSVYGHVLSCVNWHGRIFCCHGHKVRCNKPGLDALISEWLYGEGRCMQDVELRRNSVRGKSPCSLPEPKQVGE